MAVVIRMPEVLTGATEAVLSVWMVDVGDDVTVDQPIAELETDKATVEYPAESAGTFAGALVEVGARVEVGTPIAVLAEEGQSVEAALREAETHVAGTVDEGAGPAGEETQPSAGPSVGPVDEPAHEATRLFASPLVRRIVRERGLDLSTVVGSGPGGRIVRRDLYGLEAPGAAPAARTPSTRPVAETTPPSTAPDEGGYADIPHSGMRRAIARRLTESKATVPHFYVTAHCRVDALLELRRTIGEATSRRISVNDLVLKAVAGAFQEVPQANAIWTEEAVRRFDDVDIAVAVAVDDGLVTPVLRRVDQRSLGEVATQVRDLAERARTGGLRQHEIDGGSFTVSNLGMYGTQDFAAIINPPHAGILAVGATEPRPVVVDGELSVATMMTVTLSADHRVLDGAVAAQWLAAFVRRIESPLTILV